MKISVWSDLQLHTWEQFGISKDNMSRRFFEQASILDQIAVIHKDRKIDLSIFGGDWVHLVGSHPTAVMVLTMEYFKKDRTPYLFADGNHDLEDTTSPTRWQNIATMLRELSEHWTQSLFTDYKIKIVNFQDEVDYDKIQGYDVVVLHKQPALINEYGHKFNGVDWERLAKQNRLVFFGHDHTRRKLADNCYVVGAPMHHTFGDKGDRGIYIVDTDTWSVEFIKLKYPEFRTVASRAEIVEGDGNYYKGPDIGEGDGLVSVRTPVVFEQRIKSEGFKDILVEWLKLNNKDETYLLMIEDIIKDKVQVVKDFFSGKITRVNVEDFISVGGAEYNLETGVTFLSGLNGSGKSTLTGEAIYWCLFGKTTKGLTGDAVIRDGCKDCSVIVQLGDDYEIVRTRSGGIEILKFKDKEDLAEGLRQEDRQELLERILGFNESVFKAACYFSQEDLVMLTGLTDADRTDMITNLLGFETYDDLYVRVHDKQRAFIKERDNLVSQKQEIDTAIQVVESKISSNIRSISDYDKEMGITRVDIVMYEDRIKEFRRTLTALEIPVANGGVEEIDGIIAAKESIRDTIKESIQRVAEEIKEKKYDVALNGFSNREGKISSDLSTIGKEGTRLRNEIENPVGTVPPRYDTTIQELSGKVGQLKGMYESREAVISGYAREIADMQNVQLNVRCTKCGALVTEANVQTFIDERKGWIESGTKEKLDIAAQIDKMNADITIAKTERQKALQDSIDRYINEREYKLGDLADKSRELSEQLDVLCAEKKKVQDEYQGALNEKVALEKKLGTIETELKRARIEKDERITKVTEQVELKIRTEKNIENNDNMITLANSRVRETQLKVDALRKENQEYGKQLDFKGSQLDEADFRIDKIDKGMDVLEFWKIAFSAKGIRSVLLDRFCNEFNTIVNEYLSTVTQGQMSIVVSPTATTKKGEERNKIGLMITKGQYERTYKALSGGQKRRVDISLCLALNKWVSKKYGVENGLLGLIILDEVFSFIDPVGEESMATMVYREAKNKSIFVISHTPALASYANRVWRVKMVNDISYLEVT